MYVRYGNSTVPKIGDGKLMETQEETDVYVRTYVRSKYSVTGLSTAAYVRTDQKLDLLIRFCRYGTVPGTGTVAVQSYWAQNSFFVLEV